AHDPVRTNDPACFSGRNIRLTYMDAVEAGTHRQLRMVIHDEPEPAGGISPYYFGITHDFVLTALLVAILQQGHARIFKVADNVRQIRSTLKRGQERGVQNGIKRPQ